MYRHIIWDFDGTLFDTYPSMVGALRDVLKSRGREPDEAEVLGLFKISAGTALSHYRDLYGYGEDFLAEYKLRRKEVELALCLPYPGVKELLRDIASAGGQNYIFTHRGETLFPMLERHGVSGCFRECVTAGSGFPRKPDPAGIEYLLEKYAIDRRDALMVGDRELDVRSGQNAFIASCDYWDGSGPMVEGAEYIARNFGELRRVIGLTA